MALSPHLFFLFLAAFCSLAAAQSPSPEKTPVPAQGIDFSTVYDGELVSNVAGGAQRGTVLHGSLQEQVSLDFAKLFGWRETTGSLYGMLLHGARPESLSSAAQGVSSISGPAGLRLDEAWVQRNFNKDRLSLLGGLYDLNGEFYRLNSAGVFINPSFGVGPEFSQSGPESVPAFPNTSLAARAQYKATPRLVLRGAVLDAHPLRAGTTNAITVGGRGALLVSEAAWLERPEEVLRRSGRLRTGRFAELAPYEDKYALGLWHYTATFQDLSAVDANGEPVLHRGSSGAYVLVDRLLVRPPTGGGPKASAFLQLGFGDERVNRFGSYVGTGLRVRGFSRARPKDEIGLALASARNGSHYMEQQAQLGSASLRTETVFELTYIPWISDQLSLQPDVQYIVHPNTDPALENALNLLLRVEITF